MFQVSVVRKCGTVEIVGEVSTEDAGWRMLALMEYEDAARGFATWTHGYVDRV
jgi:hypothetical protein